MRLGLIVAELVKTHSLQAKPDQIRRQIEEFAQAYENPGEVIRHYFSDRNRLAEIEAIVIEQNVVDWVLAKARVSEDVVPFDELMRAGLSAPAQCRLTSCVQHRSEFAHDPQQPRRGPRQRPSRAAPPSRRVWAWCRW